MPELCDWDDCPHKASKRIRFMVKNEIWAHYCEKHGKMAHDFLLEGKHRPNDIESLQRIRRWQ